jgi:hypothetical protein
LPKYPGIDNAASRMRMTLSASQLHRIIARSSFAELLRIMKEKQR